MTRIDYYFDYAAATPLDGRVLEAMSPYFQEEFFNPSSPYEPAVAVTRRYNDAKRELARTFGATGDELVMTAGATESINLAIGSLSGHKVAPATEHKSVLEAIRRHDHTIVAVDKFGRVTPQDVVDAINDETDLVSVALANHEIGTVQPIRDIAEALESIRVSRRERGVATPLLFHCDASQGFGLIDINVGRLGVDLLTLNAAKIYGPKQVGLLWVRPGVILSPQIVGGGQEQGLRSGTENVAGVVGFAVAAVRAAEKRSSEFIRLAELRNYFESLISEQHPGAVFSGHPKHRLGSFSHVSFPGIDAERLVFILERHQIYVATSSACAANSGTRSTVLIAIGADDSVADGSIRLTLGRYTTKESIEYVARQLGESVASELERTGVTL